MFVSNCCKEDRKSLLFLNIFFSFLFSALFLFFHYFIFFHVSRFFLYFSTYYSINFLLQKIKRDFEDLCDLIPPNQQETWSTPR